MDKIGELKEKLAWAYAYTVNDPYELDDFKFAFEAGFDAAMELQLPVLFMDWAFKNQDYHWTGETWDELTGHDDFESLTHKELYDYWLENIFTNENKI